MCNFVVHILVQTSLFSGRLLDSGGAGYVPLRYFVRLSTMQLDYTFAKAGNRRLPLRV